jgi:hypothetical protein
MYQEHGYDRFRPDSGCRSVRFWRLIFDPNHLQTDIKTPELAGVLCAGKRLQLVELT